MLVPLLRCVTRGRCHGSVDWVSRRFERPSDESVHPLASATVTTVRRRLTGAAVSRLTAAPLFKVAQNLVAAGDDLVALASARESTSISVAPVMPVVPERTWRAACRARPCRTTKTPCIGAGTLVLRDGGSACDAFPGLATAFIGGVVHGQRLDGNREDVRSCARW